MQSFRRLSAISFPTPALGAGRLLVHICALHMQCACRPNLSARRAHLPDMIQRVNRRYGLYSSVQFPFDIHVCHIREET